VTTAVEGIAAVIGEPMRGRPLILEEPDVLALTEGTPVFYGDREAGQVTRLWTEGALLRWAGLLDDIAPTGDVLDLAAAGDPLRVPVPDFGVAGLIVAGALVGVPAVVSGRMETRSGVTRVSGWSLARIDLVRARPWPEVALRVTGSAAVPWVRAGAV
jgi:hypothetical protein